MSVSLLNQPAASAPTKPAVRGKVPLWRKWVLWRRLTAGAFLALLVISQFDFFPWFRGSTSGTKLLDLIPLTDPLAAVETLAATRSAAPTMLIGAGILILVAILLGPIFCGFVCPLGLLLDLNQWLRRTVRKVIFGKTRREPVPSDIPGWIRYTVLGLLLGFALVSGLPLFQALSPINLFVRALVYGSLLGLFVVGVIASVEWINPRLWCRAVCPLGALYSLLGRFAILRVRIDPNEAGKIRCKQCEVRCPMGIPVMGGFTLREKRSISHPSCIRCGDCIDVCPRSVLGLRFRPYPKAQPVAGQTATGLGLTVLGTTNTANKDACDFCGHDDPPA